LHESKNLGEIKKMFVDKIIAILEQTNVRWEYYIFFVTW